MIKEIVKDHFFLSLKSEEAKLEDYYIIEDLKDTLNAHKGNCVGMAANMIGYRKTILIFQEGKNQVILINPKILKTSGKIYTCEEGCLCHPTTKMTKRFEKIKVSYIDEYGKNKIKTYEGFIAQIIQHEMDHFEGILI